DQSAAGAIEIIAEKHSAADILRQLCLEISFGCFNRVAVFGESDGAAAPFASCTINAIVLGDWRWDVGRATLCSFSIPPEDLTGLGIYAHQALLQILHILLHACRFDDDDRRIRRLISFRHRALPDDF